MNLESSVRRLQKHAALAEFLTHWILHLTIATALSGAVAIFFRTFQGFTRGEAALSFLIVIFTPLTAWLAAKSKFIHRDTAAAWLDLRAGATGLLLTSAERPDERWSDATRAVAGRAGALPAISLRRQLLQFAPAILFAIAAIAIPVSRNARNASIPRAAAEALEEKLAILEQNIQLEEKTAEELRERVDRMKNEIETMQPEVAYEAVDRLEDKLQNEAVKAASSAREAMTALESAAMTTKDAAAAQEALEQALSEMKGAGLEKGMEEKLSKTGISDNLTIPKNVKLSKNESEKLSNAAREALREKLEKLKKSGLLTNSKLAMSGEKTGKKSQIDWNKFKEHQCDSTCKGGT